MPNMCVSLFGHYDFQAPHKLINIYTFYVRKTAVNLKNHLYSGMLEYTSCVVVGMLYKGSYYTHYYNSLMHEGVILVSCFERFNPSKNTVKKKQVI